MKSFFFFLSGFSISSVFYSVAKTLLPNDGISFTVRSNSDKFPTSGGCNGGYIHPLCKVYEFSSEYDYIYQ